MASASGETLASGAPLAPGDLGDEVADQDGDVAGAIAQRRHAHGDHVDAEVEILAEAAGLDLGVEVAVGGAHQAHVDADGLGAADRAHFAVLQHAQDLRLHLGAHVADLVEKQGAAVGGLEQAALGRRPRR